jgi:DNA polymerase V
MKAIVDCNSFYCSCERVFQPALQNKPVVVLSNNDGCIISRSDEARKLGVNMAGPFFMAKDLIHKHGVTVFSSNYNLYGDLSRRVMDILHHLVGKENVEVYSVDEAFITLDAYSTAQLHTLSRQLIDTIRQWTSIEVSIGIAPTKTLAKMANKMAKQDKLQSQCISILDTEESIREALKTMKVGSVWGVGGRYADKLQQLGICTAWDLRNMSEEWARKNLGGVVGVRLVKELRGEHAIEMKDALEKKKMIATTRMFGQTVTALQDIREAVATYAARASEKLRRQSGAASIVSTFLVTQEKIDGPRFKHGLTISAYTTLTEPTAVTNEIIKPAVRMAEQLFEEGKRYKKAGVIVSGIVPDNAIQADLFNQYKSIGRLLMDHIDNINFSMRGDMVKFASSGTKRNWKMRQDHHSKRYTTRWEELCEVS